MDKDYNRSPQEVLDELHTSAQGLTPEEAAARLAKHGPNKLKEAEKPSVFQLPFGVTSRYTWLTDSVFQPYAGLKLGANYAELSSYYYVVKQYNDTWGFFLSPEIGVSIFPRPDYRFGFHVALYYSYATNSGDVLTYSVNNLNNFGIRVGISF